MVELDVKGMDAESIRMVRVELANGATMFVEAVETTRARPP